MRINYQAQWAYIQLNAYIFFYYIFDLWSIDLISNMCWAHHRRVKRIGGYNGNKQNISHYVNQKYVIVAINSRFVALNNNRSSNFRSTIIIIIIIYNHRHHQTSKTHSFRSQFSIFFFKALLFPRVCGDFVDRFEPFKQLDTITEERNKNNSKIGSILMALFFYSLIRFQTIAHIFFLSLLLLTIYTLNLFDENCARQKLCEQNQLVICLVGFSCLAVYIEL